VTVTSSSRLEGVLSMPLTASFSHANLRSFPTRRSSDLNWGDGNTTSFTTADVSGTNGNYTVSGSHQYADEGTYSITVTVNDVGGNGTAQNGTTVAAQARMTASACNASGGAEGVNSTTLS